MGGKEETSNHLVVLSSGEGMRERGWQEHLSSWCGGSQQVAIGVMVYMDLQPKGNELLVGSSLVVIRSCIC
ncbi:hypothetical protein XELAEV_18029376mg [Xenopus laevis]|uniref:Uncharacterized protein n=1 Tax=Xenopus laevis TaxID=8355 RepID=A0A974CT07_XENLA|nr:hypothetical protein XELAEV_18029376mg [Xenopus laevis]